MELEERRRLTLLASIAASFRPTTAELLCFPLPPTALKRRPTEQGNQQLTMKEIDFHFHTHNKQAQRLHTN